MIFFVSIAIVFNVSLAKFQMKNALPTDFELSTMSAVIASMIFGLNVGLFVGVSTKLIAIVLRGKFILDNLFQILSYCIAAWIAFHLSSWNIVTLGLIITILTNVFMFLISQYVLAVSIIDNLSYTVTNFIGNVLFFLVIAEPIYILFNL